MTTYSSPINSHSFFKHILLFHPYNAKFISWEQIKHELHKATLFICVKTSAPRNYTRIVLTHNKYHLSSSDSKEWNKQRSSKTQNINT